MRISDWSSDVCSSDLHPASAGAVRETLMRDRNIFLIVIALTCIAPFVERPVIAAEILIFAIVAVANNIMLGYTGMLSFGQATFFGFGAYAAGQIGRASCRERVCQYV